MHAGDPKSQKTQYLFVMRSIPHQLLLDHFAGASNQGACLETILNHAGLDPIYLKDTSKSLSLPEFGRVVKSTFHLLQDESSGFLNRPLKPGTFAFMCYATISSRNLKECFERACRFFNLISDELRFSLAEYEESVQLSIHCRTKQRLNEGYLVLSMMVILVRWASWMTARPMTLEGLKFQCAPPEYHSAVHTLFGCPPTYRQRDNALIFDRSLLKLPIVQTNDSLVPFLAKAPGNLLTRFRSEKSVVVMVQRLLQVDLNRNLSLDEVAARLHMTTQTLRRRLRLEDNSFQNLKDKARRSQAIYKLTEQNLSIQEIAEASGYSDPSAFCRAFKKWTGYSPSEYRETHQ